MKCFAAVNTANIVFDTFVCW